MSPAHEDFVSLAEMEDSLLRNVFRGYQKWVRPVQHANDTITVRFGLKISQLVDVVRLHTLTRKNTELFATIYHFCVLICAVVLVLPQKAKSISKRCS